MLRNLQLRSGVMSFLFMFLIQAGIFFTVALFLSVALGISAVQTGVRLLPLSLSLLVFAIGVPKLRPNANPRRVVRVGFMLLFAGLVLLVALLNVGVGPEIVTWPLLLAGAGLGAMASQLGAVTVSAEPDEKSGEVGGLQNTGTQLGASIGTALAGAVLISAMTAAFFTGIQNNPNVPSSVVSKAQTELASGVPFMSETDVKAALSKANVPSATANEIIKVNKQSQIDGLRTAEAILALLALIALPFTRGIPTAQPGAQPKPTAPQGLEKTLASRDKNAIGPSDSLDHALADFAQTNADQNDATTPRTVTPSKTGPVTATGGAAVHIGVSIPITRLRRPHDATPSFTLTSQVMAVRRHAEVSDSATVRSRRATDSFAGLPMAQSALEFASDRHAESVPGDRPRTLHRPSNRGRLATTHGRAARRSHSRRFAS